MLQRLLLSCSCAAVTEEEKKAELWEAARTGNAAAIRRLGSRAPYINAESNAKTALHIAAEAGLAEVVAVLLAKGAAPNILDGRGLTALHIAVKRGHAAVVEALLQGKPGAAADPNQYSVHGDTPMHVAVAANRPDMVALLAARGGNPDAERKGDSHDSPLTLAARQGCVAAAEALVAAGAPPGARHGGKSALHVAIECGSEEVMEFLLKAGAPPGLEDVCGSTPLHAAVKAGNVEAIRALVAKGASPAAADLGKEMPLHLAAAAGQLAVVEALLQAGADPNAQGPEAQTPLHLASAAGHEPVVRALLKAGADADLASRSRQTALHLAAGRGHVAATQALLGAGAPLEARDVLGRTPLRFAVEGGHEVVVGILAARGADVNSVAQFQQQSNGGDGGNGGQAGSGGSTPLLWAAAAGTLPVLQALLDAEVSVNLRESGTGRTALMAAAARGWEEGVRLLLGAGAQLGDKDSTGATALHAAAKAGALGVVEQLLKAGADPRAKDKSGATAAQAAVGEEVAARLQAAKRSTAGGLLQRTGLVGSLFKS